MSERLPKEYAILREKYKKLEKENIKLKKIIKECHEYIKCLRNKETYFCGYPEEKEYSYLKLAKVIKEAKLKSCLIDI